MVDPARICSDLAVFSPIRRLQAQGGTDPLVEVAGGCEPAGEDASAVAARDCLAAVRSARVGLCPCCGGVSPVNVLLPWRYGGGDGGCRVLRRPGSCEEGDGGACFGEDRRAEAPVLHVRGGALPGAGEAGFVTQGGGPGVPTARFTPLGGFRRQAVRPDTAAGSRWGPLVVRRCGGWPRAAMWRPRVLGGGGTVTWWRLAVRWRGDDRRSKLRPWCGWWRCCVAGAARGLVAAGCGCTELQLRGVHL
uniref:Uncharacterized protein n=1 Tax=Arundo donax TaxID=35708 RepID=A0A0A9GRG4_ARUDO